MLKPAIRKIRDIRGKRIIGYEASLGPMCSDRHSASPALATQDLEDRLLNTLKRVDRGASVRTWNGHVFVIVPTLHGYAYWLDTFGRLSFNDGGPDEEKAIASAFHHLTQSVWTADVDDYTFLQSIPDRSVRSELASWIAFQRCFIRVRNAGELTENGQQHQAACEMSSQYAREHFAAYLS